MAKKKNNDYIVPFKGAKLSKKDANKTGITILVSILGIFLSFLITDNEILRIVIVFLSAAIGYFIIGNFLFKDR